MGNFKTNKLPKGHYKYSSDKIKVNDVGHINNVVWTDIAQRFGLILNKTQFAKLINPSFDSRFTNYLLNKGLLFALSVEGSSYCITLSEAKRFYSELSRGTIKIGKWK